MIYHREGLTQLIDRHNPKIVEIGVNRGGFFESWYPQVAWREPQVWLVDLWEGDEQQAFHEGTAKEYLALMNKYAAWENIHFVRFDSVLAADMFPDSFFDWVYIDADHRYENVKADILAWLPKTYNIISGHDLAPDPQNYFFKEFGVEKAVKEVFSDGYQETQGGVYWRSWYKSVKQKKTTVL